VVEEIDRNIHSASSTTISIARNKAFVSFPSSDDSPYLEVEHRPEREKENWSLRRGCEWIDYRVQEYFSWYCWSSALRSYLSNISIYSPEATEEVISFRHCRTIDNVCHGRENESCEFFFLRMSIY